MANRWELDDYPVNRLFQDTPSEHRTPDHFMDDDTLFDGLTGFALGALLGGVFGAVFLGVAGAFGMRSVGVWGAERMSDYIRNTPAAIQYAGKLAARADYLYGLTQGALYGTAERKANNYKILCREAQVANLTDENIRYINQLVARLKD